MRDSSDCVTTRKRVMSDADNAKPDLFELHELLDSRVHERSGPENFSAALTDVDGWQSVPGMTD
jgi:hypothetical protein